MEEILAAERAAEQHALQALSSFREQKLGDVQAALNEYHQLAQVAALDDFANAAEHEVRLWAVLTEARKQFHRVLGEFRKNNASRPVETRLLIKAFLELIKQSQRNFRAYIFQLSAAAGGIPELEAVAQRERGEGLGESQQVSLDPSLRASVVESCHRVLVYLGDLSRYRASEKLDKNPDFGPAIGYYGLAATLKPTSGLGHHQQAVVALEQRRHLRAIYHLYRAMSVRESHPNAANNLRLEFEKTNAAWDKGELIQKGPPQDPDAPKHALVGWFVRFHSMCYRGEQFRGHEELELEVLACLANVVKQRDLGDTMLRMLLVNIAAQHNAGEGFQKYQTLRYQQSFYYYFRFNLKTFTTLLRVFHDDLRGFLLAMDSPREAELSHKLTDLGRRLLPSLRIYNMWLPTMVQMIEGLSTDEFLVESVAQFWPSYAKVLDLINQAFPVWDLEDLPDVTYMLDEDVETLEFSPFSAETTRKTWYALSSATFKPRFSDVDVVRVSTDDEMLHRIHDFLSEGTNLAAAGLAPLSIRGTRVFYGDESKVEPLTIPEPHYEAAAPAKPVGKPKPVSYASAAANGHARQSRPAPALKPSASTKTQSRENQLSRMVDDLVEEEEGNNPVTPPQQAAVHPTIIPSGDLHTALQDSIVDANQLKGKSRYATPIGRPSAKDLGVKIAVTPPGYPGLSSANGFTPANHGRLESVSKLWGNAPGARSPSFASGFPAGTLTSSRPTAHGHGHSRVNSASSVRSRNSLNVIDSWASTQTNDPGAPKVLPDNVIQNNVYGTASSLDQAGMASPLLFGAGGGPWSTGLQPGFAGSVSPPNGQGG